MHLRKPRKTTDQNEDAFYDELNKLISKIPSQKAVIVGIDANAKMGLEQQSDGLGKWFYHMEQTSDNGNRLMDLCEQANLTIASTLERNHRRYQLAWQGTTPLKSEEQQKRKRPTLKLQFDFVLTKNIPLSDILISRAVWHVAFDFDHRSFLLSLKVETPPTSDDQYWITDQRVNDPDCFTKCIREEKRLRRLCRQLQRHRENGWTSTAKEFEKAPEVKEPRKGKAR
ncbi:hypothetical protein RB195_004157 [Necator americanus]|uniref:Endonuclease/exonuclease/phosphatase domain-containing protein n=1 Tax=Necator americanus TaxID=51031 RepID=A0ABR1BKS7_NECAM